MPTLAKDAVLSPVEQALPVFAACCHNGHGHAEVSNSVCYQHNNAVVEELELWQSHGCKREDTWCELAPLSQGDSGSRQTGQCSRRSVWHTAHDGTGLMTGLRCCAQVHNLTIRAKGKVLLEGTTLTVAAGRRYGLVGPNGKGKSTLLRMVARRQLPVPDALDVLLVEQVSA